MVNVYPAMSKADKTYSWNDFFVGKNFVII